MPSTTKHQLGRILTIYLHEISNLMDDLLFINTGRIYENEIILSALFMNEIQFNNRKFRHKY